MRPKPSFIVKALSVRTILRIRPPSARQQKRHTRDYLSKLERTISAVPSTYRTWSYTTRRPAPTSAGHFNYIYRPTADKTLFLQKFYAFLLTSSSILLRISPRVWDLKALLLFSKRSIVFIKPSDSVFKVGQFNKWQGCLSILCVARTSVRCFMSDMAPTIL